MTHLDLLPSDAELPTLQLALDSMELTPNETLLLASAGPRLTESADPMADLAAIVAEEAQADVSTDEDHPSPAAAFLARIEQAQPEQLRALVIYALQKSWITEGVMPPGGGLQVTD
jgi:hypothetical protein